MTAIINSTKNLWRKSAKVKDSLNDGDRVVTIAVIGCGQRGKVWNIRETLLLIILLLRCTGLLEIRPYLSRSVQNRSHCRTSSKYSTAFCHFAQCRHNSDIQYLAGTSRSICGNDQYHRKTPSRCCPGCTPGSSPCRSC